MDIIEFFKKATDLVPTEDQKLFLWALVDPAVQKIVSSCGRQTGKSICSAVATIFWVLENPNVEDVLLMSAMDSYVYDHIQRIFARNSDWAGEIVQEGVTGLVPLRGFQVKRGSRVHVRGATSKQVRGLPATKVIVDEAEEIPDVMLTTVMGNLSGPYFKFVMLGTGHREGLFTKVIRDSPKNGFKHFTWSGEKCAWHTPELLKMQKTAMSHQQYKVEVLGEVLTTADRALFSGKHLDACIYESIEKENAPNSRIEAGLDWGFEPARTVLCVTERIFNRRRMLNIKEWAKKPIEAIAPEIAKILEEYKVTMVKADARPPEYKHQVEKYTKIPIYYIEGNMHKDAMLSQLQRKIRQHSLELPQGELTLITQLRKYRKAAMRNDDYVDALAFSCYEPAEPLEARPTPTVIM